MTAAGHCRTWSAQSHVDYACAAADQLAAPAAKMTATVAENLMGLAALHAQIALAKAALEAAR